MIRAFDPSVDKGKPILELRNISIGDQEQLKAVPSDVPFDVAARTPWYYVVDDKEMIPEKEKGGPGSGHWGHAGNPGHRGGSLPGRMHGRGQVTRDYFIRGPGKKLVEDLSPDHREQVIGILTNRNIQPWHLAGLDGIDEDIPSDQLDPAASKDEHGWPRTGGERSVNGVYSVNPITGDEIIYLKPQPFLTETNISGHTLAHELGHHVTMINVAVESGIRNPVDENMIYTTLFSGLDKAYDLIRLEKGRHGRTPKEAQERLDEIFSGMGLRPYSMTHPREFAADTFAVYMFGSGMQKAELSKFLGVPSLESIFYWEEGKPVGREVLE